jgi:hypothetical protein
MKGNHNWKRVLVFDLSRAEAGKMRGDHDGKGDLNGKPATSTTTSDAKAYETRGGSNIHIRQDRSKKRAESDEMRWFYYHT